MHCISKFDPRLGRLPFGSGNTGYLFSKIQVLIQIAFVLALSADRSKRDGTKSQSSIGTINSRCCHFSSPGMIVDRECIAPLSTKKKY